VGTIKAKMKTISITNTSKFWGNWIPLLSKL